MTDKKGLVCVYCGKSWPSYANVCPKCGGFCSWGESRGSEPSSWIKTDNGYTPKPLPKTHKTKDVPEWHQMETKNG